MKNLCKFIVFLTLSLAVISAYASENSPMVFNITGLKGDPLTNAKTRLQTSVGSEKKLTATAAGEIYADGAYNIKRAIEPYGYFKATVTPAGLRFDGKQWIANFRVSPGPALKVTEMRIRIIGPGKNNRQILRAKRRVNLKVGKVFTAPEYRTVQKSLLDAAHRQGFIKASFTTNRVIINLVNNTCRINMVLDTHAQYHFGLTQFEKNPLNETFLRRFLTYKRGEVFSSQQLLAFENGLNSSGYFRGVNALPQVGKAKNDEVPIYVEVTPNKRQLYEIGVGYGTVTGPRIQGAIHWRWVNAYGHRFSTQFNLSKIGQFLQASYVIPGRNPVTDSYSLNAGIFNLTPPGGESTVYKVGASYIKQLGLWQANLGLHYIIERFRVQKHLPYQTAHYLMPSITLTWQDVRNVIDIKNGSHFAFTIQGADKGFASDINFFQAQLNFKTIQTFFTDYRFLFRLNLGATGTNNLDKLPLSLRFYAGGPDSIRGYGIQSIGPGRYLTVGSVELQRRVYKQFYAAVFYDVGNAFDKFNNYYSNLKQGTGVGAVWLSPVGAVSIYLAKALNASGRPIRVEFDFGTAL